MHPHEQLIAWVAIQGHRKALTHTSVVISACHAYSIVWCPNWNLQEHAFLNSDDIPGHAVMDGQEDAVLATLSSCCLV